MDKWGEIADSILKNKKHFPDHFFPEITSNYTMDRVLFNPNGHKLHLTSNNLVFTQILEKGNFDSDFSQFESRIKEYIIPEIVVKNQLVATRLGAVYSCKLEDEEINKFAKKYFNPEINGISDFRFAKKEKTLEGSIWQGTDNFINKIFLVGRIESNKGISYDFQLHFVPPQSEIRDKIGSFLLESKKQFNKDIVDVIEGSNGKK